jgi:hypothetical protein
LTARSASAAKKRPPEAAAARAPEGVDRAAVKRVHQHTVLHLALLEVPGCSKGRDARSAGDGEKGGLKSSCRAGRRWAAGAEAALTALKRAAELQSKSLFVQCHAMPCAALHPAALVSPSAGQLRGARPTGCAR